MLKVKTLDSIISHIEEVVQKTSLSHLDKLDDFLSYYYIKDNGAVYHNKTIKICTQGNDIIDVPIVSLLPLNFMAMSKANVRIETKMSDLQGKTKSHNKRNIFLKGSGNIIIDIDYISIPPTELLQKIIDHSN